jgi:hypothetical protein
VGYLTYGTDAANMLFHVVNERHRRRRAMIFTTNKSLKAWGRVLHDDDLAQAIIDRVLERGRLIRLDGPSVRTLHVNLDEAMKEESDSGDDVIRISGTHTTHVRFPGTTCDACVQRPVCITTAAGHGRSIALHPQEALLQALRADMRTPAGRAVLRQRTHVEHRLARLGQIQGQKARHTGTRKNTLDVRRSAAVANLQECRRLATAA